MKIFKKNQVVIFVIALMFITAGYLNFTNQKREEDNLIPTSSLADSEQMAAIGDAKLVSAEETTQNQENNIIVNEESNNLQNEQISTVDKEPTLEDSYFTQSKLDRDNMYSQMLENYQKILETSNLTSEEKTNTQNEIKRINNEKNAIMIAENLIKTKGFSDVVIFVNNTNVTAVIKTESLNEQSIAQIQNIITRELDVKTNKINISNKK